MSSVVERFMRYIKIDTQSDFDAAETTPSTAKQYDLARLLVKELEQMGLQDILLTDKCYVMATLPTNIVKDAPVIGFVAHMDTSPDASGKDVKPQIWQNYDGGELVLNREKKIKLSPTKFPEMKKYIGHTLITTDGTTLLGADDKAGVAEIMAAIEVLAHRPEIPHGTIKVGFTPDEEIGNGPKYFDVKRFGADFAYTLDGEEVGQLQFENFNAAEARVIIQGRNVHPGTAKGKMINAILVATEMLDALPANERPENTEKYEGFFHPTRISGSVEDANFTMIIRDHDRNSFEARKNLIQKITTDLNAKYGAGVVTTVLRDQYYNMRERIVPERTYILDLAEKAMKELGIAPLYVPVRGGTDGATFSYMGLPTPNIFAGGHNAHGKYEYVSTQSLEKAVDVVLKIIELAARQ
jgi:tripeptide aminopeptidase